MYTLIRWFWRQHANSLTTLRYIDLLPCLLVVNTFYSTRKYLDPSSAQAVEIKVSLDCEGCWSTGYRVVRTHKDRPTSSTLEQKKKLSEKIGCFFLLKVRAHSPAAELPFLTDQSLGSWLPNLNTLNKNNGVLTS